MTPPNDQELRFHATLEDDVSPRADRLEKKLRRMGMSPAEVKMVVRAVDDATPRIKEVQKQINALPQQTVINIQANTAEATRQVDAFQQHTEKRRIKLTFIDNLQEIGDKIFSLRTKVPLPLAGSAPGMNMLYAGGGAGIGLGAAAGAASVLEKSVKINSQMEQSLVTLAQTMKDQTQATKEMGKLVTMAQKTPFNYQDLLQADVRLRSYAIPTMPGEGGPQKPGTKGQQNTQGWLMGAGNMAAAMNTPITQAVEAIADARQGYFVRMMTYGIRMMREDFDRGGKFSGMTYEQALERVMRRFNGAQEAQSKTFQGIMSNLQDVLQQNVIKPIGGPAFEMIRQGAGNLQDKLVGNNPQAMQFQQDLGRTIEKLQHQMVALYQMLQNGRRIFDDNIKQPLIEIGTNVAMVGKDFARAFGGSMAFMLQAVSEGLFEIVRPITSLIRSMPVLTQFYGVMKAMSVLGFGNMSQPFLNLFAMFNPLTNASTGLLRTMLQLPAAITKMVVALQIKNFLDARQATKAINDEFTDLGERKLQKVNMQISQMAQGLGRSSVEMKRLVMAAADGLPGGMGAGRRETTALTIAQRSTQLNQQTGADATIAAKMIAQEVSRTGKFDSRSIDRFAETVGDASNVAKSFGMSLKDVQQTMVLFASQMQAARFVGPGGSAAVLSIEQALKAGGPLTKQQMGSGLRSPDDVMRGMLQSYTRPSLDTLRGVGGQNFTQLGKFWNFRNTQDLARNADLLTGSHNTTWHNMQAAQTQDRRMAALAPDAGALPQYMNPIDDLGAGLSRKQVGAMQADQDPARRAGALASAWSKTSDAMKTATQVVDALTQQQNKQNSALIMAQTATEQLGHVMQIWQQQNLQPLQQKIEDMGLAIQEYSYNHLRPLERQMTRLSEASQVWQHRMSESQYEMSKYNQGLLTGEQAALDQLHALELYNRQLQLMQMSYQQIGADLGTTTIKQGYSSRVEPLMAFSLEMQMQRAQRKQQRAQLEYDLKYGEGHYQMSQASRSINQRREMGLDERLAGIKRNVNVMDEAERQQHRLGNLQYDLQQKMNVVNRELTRQQDSLTGVNLEYTKLSQGDKMRGFIKQQQDLANVTYDANKQLNITQINIDKYRDALDTLKGDADSIQKSLFPMFNFDKNANDPTAGLQQILKLAEAIPENQGGLSKGQLDALRRAVNTYQKTSNQTSADWGKRDWHDVLVQSFQDVFTGAWFRRLGETVTGLTGSKGLGTVAAIGATAWAVSSAFNIASLATRIALTGVLGRIVTAIPGVGEAIKRVALFGNRTAATWSGRAAASTARGSGFMARSLASIASRLGHIVDNPSHIFRGFESFGKQLKDAVGPIRAIRIASLRTAFGPLGGTIGSAFTFGNMSSAAGTVARTLRLPQIAARIPGIRALGGLSIGRLGLGGAGRALGRIPGLGAAGRVAGRFALPVGIGIDALSAVTGSGRTRSRGVGGLVGTGIGAGIGALFGGVGAVPGAAIGGAVGSAIGNWWPEIKKAISKLFRNIAHYFSSIFEGKNLPEKLGHAFGELIKLAISIPFKEAKLVVKLATMFGGFMLDVVKKVPDFIGDFVTSFANVIGDGLSSVVDIVKKGFSDMLGGFWNFIVDNIPGPIKSLLGIKDTKGKGSTALSVANHLVNPAQHIKDAVSVGKSFATGVGKAFGLGRAGGIPRVPYDDFPAVLHKDEMVVQAGTAAYMRSTGMQQRPGGGWGGGNANLSAWERQDLGEYDKQRQRIRMLAAEKAKQGQDTERLYTTLQRLDKEYHDKYEEYTKTTLDKVKDNRKKHFEELDKQTQASKDTTIKSLQEQLQTMNSDTDNGFKKIYGTTDKWLKDIHHRINATAKALGVSVGDTAAPSSTDSTSSNSTYAGKSARDSGSYAHGGWPSNLLIKGKGDGKGYLARVGEEQDELIVPLAPHRRERAKSLLAHAQGLVGGHKGHQCEGGHCSHPSHAHGKDPAYEPMRQAYLAFASGGFTGPFGSLAGMTPVANLARSKFGLSVTAGRTNHNVHVANSNRVSDHSWGGAIDVSNSTHPTPQMDAFYTFARTKLRDIIKQVIYKHNLVSTGGGVGGYGPNDHFNHVHIALLKQYAEDAEQTAKILAGASKGANISSLLLASSAGDIGGGYNPITQLIPRSLLGRGAGGALAFKALRSLKIAYNNRENVTGGGSGADLNAFHGGGSSSANQALGRKMAAAMGWKGGQWSALQKLWTGESGWRTTADNPTSPAYGIPQANPGSKMATAGGDWQTNPATQIKWGLGYIRSVYGTPAQALQKWMGRSPHWYAGGRDKFTVTDPAMPMVVHQGEQVSVKHPSQAATPDEDKLAKRIEELIEQIKVAKKHLKSIDDKTPEDKKKNNLDDLNAALRNAYKRQVSVDKKATASLAKEYVGDPQSGEGAMAIVTKGQKELASILREQLKKDQDRLTEMKNLLSTSKSLLATAKGSTQKTLAKKAVVASTKAVKSSQAVVKYTGTTKGKAAAKEVARVTSVIRGAKRGTSDKLIKPITGKGLTKSQTTAYKRVTKAEGDVIRAKKTVTTKDDKAAGKALSSAVAKLRSSLVSGLSKNAQHLQRLRATATRDATAARKAVRAAAASQGKKLDSHGRLVRSAVSKSGSNVVAHAAKVGASHNSHLKGVKDKVDTHGKTAHGIARKGVDETSNVKKVSDRADKKRDKAESTADKRERDFQKTALRHLEDIARKAMTVNVHNTATGATLKTTVNTSRKRGK